MKYNSIINDKIIELQLSDILDELKLSTNKKVNFDCVQISPNSYSLIMDGKSFHLSIYPNPNGYEVIVNNEFFYVKIQDEADILVNKIGLEIDNSFKMGEITADIPGLITQIFVTEEESIQVDQKLFILEAMKMENEITSPINGVIKKIYYKKGDNVEKGNLIMEVKI